MNDNTSGFSEWCVMEILGHRRLGGRVTEVQIAGAGFLRIDVPETDAGPGYSQFYPPASLYALTPTTEATARLVAGATASQPVEPWEIPQLTAPSRTRAGSLPFEDFEDDDGAEDDER